jgi:hypothetical protein
MVAEREDFPAEEGGTEHRESRSDDHGEGDPLLRAGAHR